jgi:hypothetical protein
VLLLQGVLLESLTLLLHGCRRMLNGALLLLLANGRWGGPLSLLWLDWCQLMLNGRRG